MAETNIFLLDRTHAEEETIEEESELGLESSRAQSAKDEHEEAGDADDVGTQMSWPTAEESQKDAEKGSDTEQSVTDKAAPDARAKRARRAGLIAGGSLFALVLVVVAGASFVFPDSERGPFVFVTDLISEHTNWGSTPSQTPIESASAQADGESNTLDAVLEIQQLDGMSPFEQLGYVVHSQQVERLVLGDARAQGAALASMIERAAHQLGINADHAQEYTRLKQTIERQIAPLIERSHQGASTGGEKIQTVLDSAINSGFALGATLSGTEVEAIAKEAAMEMGVELSVASVAAAQRTQELSLLAGAIEQARTSESPDRVLGQTIDQIAAMRETPTTLDEKGGWLSYAADAAGLDVAELEVVAARVQASHQAQVIGMSQNDQQVHADIAAAHARANQLGLDDYQSALFVVEHTGHHQALATIVAERGLDAEAVAALTAHIALNASAQPNQGNPADRVGYVAASVAGAARAEGAPVQRQIELANAAITYEASQHNLSASGISAERARIDAMLSAQESGLSEVEIIALGDRAAVMAGQGNNLSPLQLEQVGEQAMQEVIRSAGYGQSTEQEMIARTLAYAGTATETDGGPSTGRYESVVEQAQREAQSQGMNEMARVAYVAKALIEAQMQDVGYTGRVVEVAAAEAEAKARADLMGVSESRQRELGLSAAQAYMQALGIGSREQTIILSDIDAAKTAIADLQTQEAQAPTAPASPAEIEVAQIAPQQVAPTPASVPAEITDKLATLEQRIVALSQRMTETVALAERTAQAQERTAQAQESVFSEMREAIAQMEQSVQTQLSEMQGTVESAESVATETDRLRANFGWLSNRVCEAEAVTGTFSNPRACEAVYAKYTQAGNQAAQPAQPQATQASVQATQVSAKVPTAQIRGAPAAQRQTQPAERTMGALPQTRTNNEQAGQERVFAALPQTHSRETQAPIHVSSTACDNAVEGYRYVTITENNATIANQWGATQRIVRDSYVPELGAVIHIQARHQPRFVMFENGIVCR